MDDPRAQEAVHLRRITDDILKLEEVKSGEIIVLSWLENVASMTRQTRRAYDKLLNATPVCIYGNSFGYVRRTRLFWGQINGHPLADYDFETPAGVSCTPRVKYPEIPEAWWIGPKPLPPKSNTLLEDGFTLAFDPNSVVADAGKFCTHQIPKGTAHERGIETCTQ